ncbi:hypothetical protein [Clostridium tertium]|uniref:Uncharacterized protein n=1 Tax=Clostridium tertium TaxID=1559 RepID=A0A6N3CGS5_9CLOT
MVSKDYYSNIPSKNILKDNEKNNLSEKINETNINSLDNMVLNSNLENQNLIK